MTIQDIKAQNLLLLECISGSKAYGLATEKSDTDIRGVFYLPKEKFYGLEYIPQISNETNDEVYYELGRFMELLLKNNPNIMELLATPGDCILYKHLIMERLQPELFLSKLCKDSFAGYASTQIKKARGFKKKIVNPVEQERKSVLDFCFVMTGYSSVPLKVWLTENNMLQEYCGLTNIPHTKGMYALFYSADNSLHYSGIVSGDAANDVSLSSIPKGEKEMAYLFCNIEAYSSYCKEYREYWDWVSKRNEERYAGNQQHGKHYDAKNMMHTIRLLQMAEEIAHGNIIVRRSNREQLLQIKAGNFEYEHLLQMADELMLQINEAFKKSSLPQTPDAQMVDSLLVEMRKELYG